MATGSAGRVVQLIFAAQRPSGRFYVTTWGLFEKLLAAVIVFCLLCGIVAAVIGHLKNLSIAQSFALGAFLGPYGVVSVVHEKRGLPKAPSGMRAVKCPRCTPSRTLARHSVLRVLEVQGSECSARQSIVRYRYLRGVPIGTRPGASCQTLHAVGDDRAIEQT